MRDDSLLTRLLNRLASIAKATPRATTRLIATMLIAAVIATTATSCQNSTTQDDPYSDVGENGQGNNQGSQVYDFTKDEDFKNFSPALQKVLTDKDYYLRVIDWYEQHDKKYVSANNYCDIVPYGFLEQQGYDKDSICSGNKDTCISEMYIKDSEPNNLYINCAVLNNSDGFEYYEIFLLKYNLTKQELKDLNYLFQGGGLYNIIPYYAPFFVQELSYQKQAEIVKVGYVAKAQYLAANNSYRSLPELYDETNPELSKYINTYNNYYASVIPTAQEQIIIYEHSDISIGDNRSAEYLAPMYIALYPHVNTNDSNILKVKGYIIDDILCRQQSIFLNGIPIEELNSSSFVNIDGNYIATGGLGRITDLSYIGIDNSNVKAETATFYSVNDCTLLDPMRNINSDKNKAYATYGHAWLYKDLYNKEAPSLTNN